MFKKRGSCFNDGKKLYMNISLEKKEEKLILDREDRGGGKKMYYFNL